ncbi:MAG TPA: translocation/assembly module TamB, partial [Caulobacteraceae bacterium]
MSDEITRTDADQPVLGRRGRLHPAMWTLLIIATAALLLVIGLIGTRYGLATGPGRLFLEARLDGLKIGRFGKLKIQGLDGDIFSDFTIRRLTVSDEKGIWLDGRSLHLKWNYTALFARRFEAQELSARHVWLLRRPTLTPKEESKELPVSFEIRKIAARVETMETLSYERGLFNLTGALDIRRRGAKAGHIEARSLLHQGDFAKIAFDTGREDSLNISANVYEATGGALAGSLGMPADRPFSLAGQANGTTAKGGFIVRAVSGDQLPLRAKGSWNAEGGSAAGRIDLTASTLTRRWAERLGPTAQFQIGGKRYGDGDYMLDGKVDADNLNVVIKGPADLAARKLTPEGLAVDIRTGSIKRLFGGLVDAAASARTRLKGEPSDWTLEGPVQTRNLTAAGYRLASGAGRAKLVHRKGESTLTGTLTGAGGQGSGVLAAALGPRPQLTFTGSRLKGGDMLIRRLAIKGPGVAIDATGRRTLFGNFSFKGDATLSALSAWHEGADGVVQMTWSAGRAGKPGSAWSYDFDARAKSFASGWSEADRLLGDTPRLQAKGDYHQGVLTVDASTLDGAAGTLHARGQRAR